MKPIANPFSSEEEAEALIERVRAAHLSEEDQQQLRIGTAPARDPHGLLTQRGLLGQVVQDPRRAAENDPISHPERELITDVH